jgi:hypothetical protein
VVLVRATDPVSKASIISKSSGFTVSKPVISSFSGSCVALAGACNSLLSGSPNGPPRGPFQFVPGEPPVAPVETGYSPITKAGIAIGTIVGSCVLFAALAALIFGRGDGSYGDTVVARAPAPGITHEFS